ncbi:hypothetical protein HQ524_02820 [Candidatus Uhrbacteria bacterium]|nr:hypothetical protein [Candidatus Uhrbacteria bacterium]
MTDEEEVVARFSRMVEIVRAYLANHPDAEGEEELAEVGANLLILFDGPEELNNSMHRHMTSVMFQLYIQTLEKKKSRSKSQENLLEDLREAYTAYNEFFDPISAEDAIGSLPDKE